MLTKAISNIKVELRDSRPSTGSTKTANISNSVARQLLQHKLLFMSEKGASPAKDISPVKD